MKTARSLSKLEGLKQIEAVDLPHPNWRFIKTPDEIGDFCSKQAKYGWTIRTCLPDQEQQFRLPFANHVPQKDVKDTIKKFLAQLGDDPTFVVYPSWKFIKSGNYTLFETTVVIEAINGYLGDLTQGRRTPRVTLIYERYRRVLLKVFGDRNFLSNQEIDFFLKFNRRIKENNVVLEWSHTTDNEYLFHHWIQI